MEKIEREKTQSVFHLWIEKEKHILSFHMSEHMSDGFEKKEFYNWDDMFQHALELVSAGYRVQ